MAKDYGKTLNLPKTEFPMRANLPQREPDTQKKWEDENIYGNRRARSYPRRVILSEVEILRQ